MEALELLPIASMTLLGAATAVRCRLLASAGASAVNRMACNGAAPCRTW